MADRLRSLRRDPVFTTQHYLDQLELAAMDARGHLRTLAAEAHLATLRLGAVLTELDCLRHHLNRHGHEAAGTTESPHG